MKTERFDVIVVGGGNAGFSAALAAKEHAPAEARVLVIDKAPLDWAGGNSYFTAGATRMTYASLDELIPLLDEPNDERIKVTDLPPYSPEDFIADMRRVTLNRCDPELTRLLAYESADAVRWLQSKGIRYRLMYDRQSFLVEGRYGFFGNLTIGVVDGGKGMIAQYHELLPRFGIEVRHGTGMVDLLRADNGAVAGIIAQGADYARARLEAPAVILAAGGFESDKKRRNANLGPGWDLAKVRGTPFNTGDVIDIALAHGAAPAGHWSGAHSVSWDANAPGDHGDREISNRFTKQSYPIGVMVNIAGQRFLDEGADFRNYTYAKYGVEVLRQPGSLAFHIFDAKTEPILRQDEYRAPGVSRYEAKTLDDLARRAGLPVEGFVKTITEFNAAVDPRPFNPAIKDGKCTHGITPPKSNWASPIDTPPFYAFAVTCGITFTFGGVKVDTDARVLEPGGEPIPGLFAAGEMLGGLFYHNYPGGSGLAAGTVFGRRAGKSAATRLRAS